MNNGVPFRQDNTCTDPNPTTHDQISAPQQGIPVAAISFRYRLHAVVQHAAHLGHLPEATGLRSCVEMSGQRSDGAVRTFTGRLDRLLHPGFDSFADATVVPLLPGDAPPQSSCRGRQLQIGQRN